MHRVIVWLRNDLRLHDNAALNWASKQGIGKKGTQTEIIPVYSFDPRFFQTKINKYDSLKCGLVRARFLRETVANLRQNLENVGSGLLVTTQKPEQFIPKLIDPKA